MAFHDIFLNVLVEDNMENQIAIKRYVLYENFRILEGNDAWLKFSKGR